jgi:hypothetical protein
MRYFLNTNWACQVSTSPLLASAKLTGRYGLIDHQRQLGMAQVAEPATAM